MELPQYGPYGTSQGISLELAETEQLLLAWHAGPAVTLESTWPVRSRRQATTSTSEADFHSACLPTSALKSP